MLKTFGKKVINFNQNLHYSGNLPDDFLVINPFLDNPETMKIMTKFYKKFYNDNHKRRFILGINPSRYGAGVTGVPFTDTKNLDKFIGIKMKSARTHEVSSVFMYALIEAFGGVKKFYSEFYLNSPFPLAIVRKKKNTFVNANYYDDKELFENVKPFMVETLKKHIALGLETEKVFVLGKKNTKFLEKLNKEVPLFGTLVPLDHPRFIEQYRSKYREDYISEYLQKFQDN